MLGKRFHTLKKGVSFSSPTNVGYHNPPPFRAQCPRWHSFLSPIDVGPPPNPFPSGPSVLTGTPPRLPPFGEQPPRWHIVRYLALISFVTAQSTPLANIVFFGLSLLGFPSGFKTCLLGKGFHTLIKGVSFSSPTNVGYHNPPPFRAQRALVPFSNRCGTPTKSTPFGAQRPY